MILISQYKVRVWYKEDLRWIVNNPDGDWMQNSCNTRKEEKLSLISNEVSEACQEVLGLCNDKESRGEN